MEDRDSMYMAASLGRGIRVGVRERLLRRMTYNKQGRAPRSTGEYGIPGNAGYLFPYAHLRTARRKESQIWPRSREVRMGQSPDSRPADFSLGRLLDRNKQEQMPCLNPGLGMIFVRFPARRSHYAEAY
jgi:hypothetical protein